MTERISIPIDELTNRVIMQLEEQHYMESTLIVYKRIYRRIKEFMLQNHYQNYFPDIATSFLSGQKVADSTMSTYKCAVRRLNDSYDDKDFRSHHKNDTAKICDVYKDLLDEYLNTCINKGNKPGTIVHKSFACIYFLNFLISAPPNTKIGRRDQMILILLYDSTIRVSELLSLDVSSVNLDAEIHYLRIYGKGDKERIVAITDTTADHMRNYLKAYHPTKDLDSPLIFTVIKGRKDRMSVGNVERIIKKYASKIRSEHPNLPEHCYPHMVRRTRATNLYQDGTEPMSFR